MKYSVLLLLLLLQFSMAKSQTLGEALKAKDTVLAAKLIASGADPNAKNEQGTTLLMQACHFPDLISARFLLNHGVKPDEPRSAKGRTPLMIACAYWCGMDMVQLLVAKGANVNATANDGTTALMLAASNEKQDVVDFLLKHGAKANQKNAENKTALDFAKAGKVEDYMVTSIKDTRFNKEAVIAALEAAAHK